MSLMSRTKPSPAMVVAVIALSFALVGTAIAGPDAITSAVTKSKVKKIDKKQAKKQIRKKAPGLSVANAVNAQNAVNADTVDGFHANSLVRSAFSQIDDNALVGPTGPGTVRTTTITAPTNGFLLVNAGSDVFGGPGTGRCVIRVNGTVIASSEREWELGANNTEEDCTTETTAAVTTGAHTVDLFAIDGVPAATRYDEAELQVLFVPFGTTGAQPTSAAKASTPGGDSNGN
jgi:hypothetical protein